MDINELCLSALRSANKPMKVGELAEVSGLDKKQVEKSIKQLNTEGKVFSPVRCFWQAK